MKTWLLAVLFAVPTAAMAQVPASLNAQAGNAGLVILENDAPKPLPPTDAPTPVAPFKFKDGKAIFDQGLQPTEQELAGDWKQIAWADVSLNFASMKNFYNEEGRRNEDKTYPMLRFGWQKKAVGPDQIFFSQFLNMGTDSADQGPFESRVDADRKAAIASCYAYRNGVQASSYYVYDCRRTQADADRLICGITLHVSPQERGTPSDAYDNVMGGMVIFKRIR